MKYYFAHKFNFVFFILATVACFASDPPFYQFAQPGVPHAKITELGRVLFFDPRLSASGKQSCASCHDPAHGFSAPNHDAVQTGGVNNEMRGERAVPALTYIARVPAFTEHYFEGEGTAGDQGPTGGYTWDGRVDSMHEQAKLPLLSPLEMANADASSVVGRVRSAGYMPTLQAIFGDSIAKDQNRIFNAVLQALEAFQRDPATFYPFSSKYDAYLRFDAKLSVQEERGLKLFKDKNKGNCASCHIADVREGSFPLFSDWGHIGLGVPRNRNIPANTNPEYFDLGLCGPARSDLSSHPEYCGLFRTPSLRNVALRNRFFHNGVISSLREAVEFYATRDTNPNKWYGKNGKFDDLPEQYHGNINQDPPFGKKAGDHPALNDQEIDDIVVFLRTLTDGYQPGSDTVSLYKNLQAHGSATASSP